MNIIEWITDIIGIPNVILWNKYIFLTINNGYLQDSVNSISDVGSVDEPGLNMVKASKFLGEWITFRIFCLYYMKCL